MVTALQQAGGSRFEQALEVCVAWSITSTQYIESFVGCENNRGSDDGGSRHAHMLYA